MTRRLALFVLLAVALASISFASLAFAEAPSRPSRASSPVAAFEEAAACLADPVCLMNATAPLGAGAGSR